MPEVYTKMTGFRQASLDEILRRVLVEKTGVGNLDNEVIGLYAHLSSSATRRRERAPSGTSPEIPSLDQLFAVFVAELEKSSAADILSGERDEALALAAAPLFGDNHAIVTTRCIAAFRRKLKQVCEREQGNPEDVEVDPMPPIAEPWRHRSRAVGPGDAAVRPRSRPGK